MPAPDAEPVRSGPLAWLPDPGRNFWRCVLLGVVMLSCLAALTYYGLLP